MSKVLSITPGKTTPLSKLIDEYGDIAEKLKPLASRKEQLQKQILSKYDSLPPEQSLDITGNRWSITISAKSLQRKIFDMARLKFFLKDKFLRLVKINLSDVDENIPAEFHPQFLKEDRTGSRTLTPYKIQICEKAA